MQDYNFGVRLFSFGGADGANSGSGRCGISPAGGCRCHADASARRVVHLEAAPNGGGLRLEARRLAIKKISKICK